MSYRQKQATATLIALCVVGLTLILRLREIGPQDMSAAFPLFVQAGLAMIVIVIFANLTLRLQGKIRGERPGDDERDFLIDLLARRNAYWFATIGLSFVVVQALRGVSVVGLAESALGAFLIAEIVGYTSRLYYYGRGV